MLAYGNLPGKNIHTAIEMYGQDRFTTITTDHMLGTPTSIEHRQEAIEALYRRFAPPVAPGEDQNTRGVRVEQRSLNSHRKRHTIQYFSNCYEAIPQVFDHHRTLILSLCSNSYTGQGIMWHSPESCF